jgi:ubiquitin C-terminal hydrolase
MYFSLTEILVLHLKRFSAGGRMRSKITGLVEAPMELDVSQFLMGTDSDVPLDPMMYDLYAVSNHFGGLGGGHCITL